MDFREYILKLLSAALLCGVAVGFFSEKSAAGSVIKMVCGVVMVLTVVSPWTHIRIRDAADYFDKIQSDGSLAAAVGENMASDELKAIIISRVEAYILDKAESYGAKLQVEVILSEDPVPTPRSVRIRGSISPYGKKMMTQMIREDLGIASEDQIWTV